MRTHHITITAGMLASVFNSSLGRAADPRPVPCLMITDANGKDVGLAQSVSGLFFGINARSTGATVALELDGSLFAVRVTHHYFVGLQGDQIYFESSDCTGTPFVRPPSDESLVAEPLVNAPGQTLYFPDTAAVPRTITVGSVLEDGGGGATINFGSAFGQRGKCTPDPPDTSTVKYVPALVSVDLDQTFTPPFTLKSKCPSFCCTVSVNATASAAVAPAAPAPRWAGLDLAAEQIR